MKIYIKADMMRKAKAPENQKGKPRLREAPALTSTQGPGWVVATTHMPAPEVPLQISTTGQKPLPSLQPEGVGSICQGNFC